MSWTSGLSEPKKRFPFLTALAACVIFLVTGFATRLSAGFDSAPRLPLPQTGGISAAPSPRTAASKPVPILPLQFISSDPWNGAEGIAPDTDIEVVFSVPLSGMTPTPTLSPAVRGVWRQLKPGTLTFLPEASFTPYATEKVTIPGGENGIIGSNGQTLGASQTFSFTVEPGSTLRLQQLLAQLYYLPLEFVPQDQSAVPPEQLAVPQPGSFAWRWTTLPASLTSLWTPGSMNVITKGAVMRFEDQAGLATDGIAGPSVWSALIEAAQSNSVDPDPYDNVVVSTALPQTVTVYSDGVPVMKTLANTGVAAAPTVVGTFSVYLRYRSTTMAGTNPDGTHYNDPGIPWVSYFNGGQALHGFIRPGYGYPQSVGCVEMPIDAAAKVWPLTPIGTLVTVL